ncbi:hypothetical protein Mag101_12760 [Microbulbifer agarilyticus]|uniref:Uncharacterized protein n=1 Tax=Microbulbifer agarilyticus TaxID=260552 RepID=A0A1Q2M6N1_9GAMM|nr:hypothetical protein [Microbulbifer agarilyticus]AQQ68405.1 hypothetical protein Mag101_12760 [Microbulbifer agarilyticus]
MSGRKKNRKHRHGQPPHELLNELSSLHELLGSDMEADIPLLDQVAGPAASGNTAQPQQTAPAKPTESSPAPKAQPRPLEEADLPILFSPIDEELEDEYAPVLSDADRELLRPLQDLPRTVAADSAQPETPKEKRPKPEPAKKSEAQADSMSASREEFQPGLFDSPRKKAEPSANPAPKKSEPTPEPAEKKAQASADASTAKSEAQADSAKPGEDKAQTIKTKPAPQRSGAENPFLPAHIRARLTGGRVPRPEDLATAKPKTEAIAPESQPTTDQVQAEQPAATESQASESTDEPKEPSAREKLIEQLMAEQLPELERQLRANITALVDEIYPEQE